MKKLFNKNESGRSMVEMLGVLAIIGVLSVGGIAGYKMAMERVQYNKMLDVFSKFELMWLTEINQWDNSIYNVADGERCSQLGTSSDKSECYLFEHEYFCDNYAGPSYCKHALFTEGINHKYYGRYSFNGSNDDSAWTWGLANGLDGNTNMRYLALTMRIPVAYCEEFIMHAYHSQLRPYLGWVGYSDGSWNFPNMNETQARQEAKIICSAESTSSFTNGKMANLGIPVLIE